MLSGKWRPFCLGLNVLNDTSDAIVIIWVNIFKALHTKLSSDHYTKDTK